MIDFFSNPVLPALSSYTIDLSQHSLGTKHQNRYPLLKLRITTSLTGGKSWLRYVNKLAPSLQFIRTGRFLEGQVTSVPFLNHFKMSHGLQMFGWWSTWNQLTWTLVHMCWPSRPCQNCSVSVWLEATRNDCRACSELSWRYKWHNWLSITDCNISRLRRASYGEKCTVCVNTAPTYCHTVVTWLFLYYLKFAWRLGCATQKRGKESEARLKKVLFRDIQVSCEGVQLCVDQLVKLWCRWWLNKWSVCFVTWRKIPAAILPSHTSVIHRGREVFERDANSLLLLYERMNADELLFVGLRKDVQPVRLRSRCRQTLKLCIVGQLAILRCILVTVVS